MADCKKSELCRQLTDQLKDLCLFQCVIEESSAISINVVVDWIGNDNRKVKSFSLIVGLGTL